MSITYTVEGNLIYKNETYTYMGRPMGSSKTIVDSVVYAIVTYNAELQQLEAHPYTYGYDAYDPMDVGEPMTDFDLVAYSGYSEIHFFVNSTHDGMYTLLGSAPFVNGVAVLPYVMEPGSAFWYQANVQDMLPHITQITG